MPLPTSTARQTRLSRLTIGTVIGAPLGGEDFRASGAQPGMGSGQVAAPLLGADDRDCGIPHSCRSGLSCLHPFAFPGVDGRADAGNGGLEIGGIAFDTDEALARADCCYAG